MTSEFQMREGLTPPPLWYTFESKISAGSNQEYLHSGAAAGWVFACCGAAGSWPPCGEVEKCRRPLPGGDAILKQ